MAGLGFCFLYFLCSDTDRQPFDSEQMDGVAGLPFFLHPTDSGVLLNLMAHTLVFNDCMEWVYSAVGCLSGIRHGQKIRFL